MTTKKKPTTTRQRIVPLTVARALGSSLLYDTRTGNFYDATGTDVTERTVTERELRFETSRPAKAAEAVNPNRVKGSTAAFVPALTMRYRFNPVTERWDAFDPATEPECDETAPDPVNHPAHYTQGAIECIDAIAAQLGPEGFVAFLRGQLAKYNWRLLAKGDPAENLAKLRWYAERLATALRG